MLREILRRNEIARYIYARAYALRYLAAREHSYSQAEEDLIVERRVGRVNFFIDIGAHDGLRGSNTFYFALKGARGVCFEPVLDTFRRLQSLYWLNSRVLCKRVGISDQDREETIMACDFLSFIPETRDENRGGVMLLPPKPETITLRRFENAIRGIDVPAHIDLLSVDVEGHELFALRSIPFERYSFGAIVVETHLGEEAVHRDIVEIEALLASNGYRAVEKTGVNTVFAPAT